MAITLVVMLAIYMWMIATVTFAQENARHEMAIQHLEMIVRNGIDYISPPIVWGEDEDCIITSGLLQNEVVSGQGRAYSELISLGYFELTFYCPCKICCGIWSEQHPSRIGTGFVQRTASGTIPVQGRTIAVDTNVFPHGTEIYITGFGWRIAEDTGSAINGRIIDIFVECHQEALQLGRIRNVEVFAGG